MIAGFRDNYYFLSNMYETPVNYDNRTYKCSEAAFQAQKTLDDKCRDMFTEFDGKTAKSTGRNVNLREDWESVKDEIMLNVCRAKFSNPDLREKLLNTGNEALIELNSWGDQYWGVSKGKGENKLGKILMQVRSELTSD